MHRVDECQHCGLRRRLIELLISERPPSASGAALIDTLCAGGRSRAALGLVRRDPQLAAVLGEITAGRRVLDHDTLDDLKPSPSVRHLRDLLVDVGALPARNRQLADFDSWCAHILDGVTPPADRRTITHYATWHHRRRLARHADDATLKPWATRVARQQIRVAIAFLAWLRTHDLSLAECRQANLDQWFSTGPTTRNSTVGFLHWARTQRHCGPLQIPTIQVARPEPMPHAERVELIARLLEGNDLTLADRVAGLLAVVCAQPPTRISRTRIDTIGDHDGDTTITLGAEHVPLAAPVAQLVNDLVAQTMARHTGSPWLFPGRIPGQPLSASTLSQRLRAIGVTQAARVAALHDLIGQVPTPILADVLGYNPAFVAERAANLSTSWNTYAGLPRD